MTSIVKAYGIHKHFGHLHVLKGVDLEVAERELVFVIGPSGSGKSTLLRCLNRLEQPSSGRIEVDGIDMLSPRTDINHARQHIGMVFQSFNLYPHMTALGNVTLALRKVAGKSQGGGRCAGACRPRAGRPRRPRAPPAGRAVGRPAAARRHRPFDRARAAGHAVRRADQRARSRAGRLGARRHARPARERHDHDRGQPRDGLRPERRRPRDLHGRRADRRAGAAGRHLRHAPPTSAHARSSGRSSSTDVFAGSAPLQWRIHERHWSAALRRQP